MTERIREEFRSLRKKPAKIICSAMVTIFMFVLTGFAWDGITKRLVICLGLSVLSGIILLLPKLPNWISIPMLALYLYYVPSKIFLRMELPMQDMSRIVDGAELLTVLFILCAYLLVFLFTQSSAAALGAGSSFFLILFLAEYYIWKFRGDFLMPSDLGAVGTAMSVMGSYNFSLSPEALYTLIYFLFFIFWGFRIGIRMGKWVHILVSVMAVLFVGGWYYTVMNTPNPLGKEFMVHYWNVGDTRNLNGACLSYFLLLKDSKVDVPGGYSEKALQAIAEAVVGDYESLQGTGQKPNIIMVMNEGWSDLRVLGELDTTEEYMPFANSLTQNAVRGNLYVSILGGLTANTEFEVLTGGSLSLLSPAVIPYQNQVRHDMSSLARVLENQGYETMAVHPNGDGAWGRNRVYTHFGFDTFIHQGNWAVPYEYMREYISDACNFKEIIYRYEERNKEVPFFLFNVTIQNHGSYQGDVPADIDIVRAGNTPGENMGDITELQNYINLLKITDDAFEEFVSYFANVEEPVIICMFGDHQPVWDEDFYNFMFEGQELTDRERNLRKYMVPYVIWANYDVQWKEYGDMSANFLPAVLVECAGLQLPSFYQYLMGLHEEYPVLTKRGCLDRDGKLTDIADIWDTDQIRRYRMFQYNQLYVEEYQREIFEEVEAVLQ